MIAGDSRAAALDLRPARPADADQVVPLMHGSSRDLIDATFGDGAGTVLRRDFARGKGLFGYRHQIVAVLPGGSIAGTMIEGTMIVGTTIVGTMTVYSGRHYRRLSLQTIRSAATLGPAGLAAAVRRTLAMSALFTPPGPGSLFVANLCVADRYRGRGYGSLLLGHATRLAAETNPPPIVTHAMTN